MSTYSSSPGKRSVAYRPKSKPYTASDLHDECCELHPRLLRIHKFHQYFALASSLGSNHKPGMRRDPVGELEDCFSLGISLCYLFNLLPSPTQPIEINTNPLEFNISDTQAKRHAFTVFAERIGNFLPSCERITIDDLPGGPDTGGIRSFLRVIEAVKALVECLPEEMFYVHVSSSITPSRRRRGSSDLPLFINSPSPVEKRWNAIVEEMIESERSYVYSLRVLKRYAESLSHSYKVDTQAMNVFLSSLDTLVDQQRLFLTSLEEVARLPIKHQNWGTCFTDHLKRWSGYDSYSANYDQNVKLLEDHGLDYPKTIVTTKADLHALLGRPLQRIGVYPLLLEVLMASTPPDYLFGPDLESGHNATKQTLLKISRRLFVYDHWSPSSHVQAFDALELELFQFRASVSPDQQPLQWLQEHKSNIHGCVLNTIGLTDKQMHDMDAILRQAIIYPHLTIYAFLHVIYSQDTPGHSIRFMELLGTWKSWDEITSLQNHHSIRDSLLELISRMPSYTDEQEYGEKLQKVLSLDFVAIGAQLIAILKTKEGRFLAQSGDNAQNLLNLMQELLDDPHLQQGLKHQLTTAIIKLSQRSGLYPECLLLSGNVQKIGEDAVASGSFGDVWKATIHGQEIAMKVVRLYVETDIKQLLKEFSREVVTWRQLSHPNLLPFYGVYHLSENHSRVCLISPWMENGNVVQFLKRNPTTDRVCLIQDIVEGLHYLHTMQPSIIHGDLKGVNILISDSLRACLADFGMAAVRDSQVMRSSTSNNKATGTLRWQAPELLSDSKQGNTRASDMYSFACVCYEIFCDNHPFFEITREISIIVPVTNGIRPSRPSPSDCYRTGLDDEMWDLIKSCWRTSPSERPTTGLVLDRLSSRPNRLPDKRPPHLWNTLLPCQLASPAHKPLIPLPLGQESNGTSTISTGRVTPRPLQSPSLSSTRTTKPLDAPRRDSTISTLMSKGAKLVHKPSKSS